MIIECADDSAVWQWQTTLDMLKATTNAEIVSIEPIELETEDAE